MNDITKLIRDSFQTHQTSDIIDIIHKFTIDPEISKNKYMYMEEK